MALTLNLKKGIDLPVYQWLRFLPAASAAGACQCTDKRGSHRYIYFLLSATSFWRYDTYTDTFQQLANPPTFTFAAGTAMTFDPSQGTAGRIWLFAPSAATPWCVFAYYDIALNTWTSRAVPSGLAAQWGTDTGLAHTCSTYNAAGNDDYIYLIGNASTTWYRYSITGNAWTAMGTVLPATAGAGCSITWTYGYNTDRLYIVRGTATASIYYWTIGTPGFTTLTYLPATETFTTGTSVCYDGVNRIYITKDATHRMFYLQLDEAKMYPGGYWPYASGAAIAGDAMSFIKTDDGAQFIYYRRQTGAEFWRTLVGWV